MPLESFFCPVVDCGRPNPIPNGVASGGVTTYLAQIRYGCSQGYRLAGDASRVCQASGQWSGDDPECERKNNPPLLAHGSTLLNGSVEAS